MYELSQTLLFEDKEKAPSASEVTYNYVLECAVQALQERYRRNGTPFVSIAPPLDPCEVSSCIAFYLIFCVCDECIFKPLSCVLFCEHCNICGFMQSD
jgi:hypothetical protein